MLVFLHDIFFVIPNKKSEALAHAHTLTLFVVPSGLEPELF